MTSLPRASLDHKERRLREVVSAFGSMVVAYSGGVDSSLLACIAHDELGSSALAVTAYSPAVPEDEVEAAVAQAADRGWRHRVVNTGEMADPRYVSNGLRRCYFCKVELYTQLRAIAFEEGVAVIANGANADDVHDYRPGMEAAEEYGVKSPLLEAQISKDEARMLSKKLGLAVWDKPAQPCLSSRIPYGTHVTVDTLEMIAKAEFSLRKMGLRYFRVRHHYPVARLEIAEDELPNFADRDFRSKTNEAVKAAGYKHVALDLSPFVSGSLNYSVRR